MADVADLATVFLNIRKVFNLTPFFLLPCLRTTLALIHHKHVNDKCFFAHELYRFIFFLRYTSYLAKALNVSLLKMGG